MKNNKSYLKIFIVIFIIIIIIASITYVRISNIQNINQSTASFKSSLYNTNYNKIWVASFQLAWNELINKLGGKVEFENNLDIANELNQQVITKDIIDSESYYIIAEKNYSGLEDKIEQDLRQKFNIDTTNILDDNIQSGDYIIYAMLNKTFEFNEPFPEVESNKFGDSDNDVKYFGVNPQTKESTANQITILFYNNQDDFAIKISTKGDDELVLYKNKDIDNFYNAYNKINQESISYTGERNINPKKDNVGIPFINLKTTINYDELCNKKIKGLDNEIGKAMQNVEFNLNNYGGNIFSEAVIETYESMTLETRELNFNDRFFLFLQEKGQDIPYFALLVENDDVLVK